MDEEEEEGVKSMGWEEKWKERKENWERLEPRRVVEVEMEMAEIELVVQMACPEKEREKVASFSSP